MDYNLLRGFVSPVIDQYRLMLESSNKKCEYCEIFLAQATILSSYIDDQHPHKFGPNYEILSMKPFKDTQKLTFYAILRHIVILYYSILLYCIIVLYHILRYYDISNYYIVFYMFIILCCIK